MIDFLFLDKNYCNYCKKEIVEKYELCQDCLSKLDYVDNKFRIDGFEAYTIYYYNDFIAKLIADYKFNRNTSLYKIFGQMVYDYAKEKNLFDMDYILACPSSKKTLNTRGFDHIKLITDYFYDKINIKYLEDFKKIKETKAQHTLSEEKRATNLKAAFKTKTNLKEKSVLIFDDIITTGNTVREISKTLAEAGAKEIKILSITSSHRII